MRLTLFLVIAVWVYVPAFSQSTTVLENNPNLRWKQVKTPNFRVIFPTGFETQALRMANTFEHIRVPESKTLGGAPRPVSVVLQNQSAISNGFVSITPRRSEFFTMPTQNYNLQGNLDWLDLLATHEYRHIVQFHQANRGFNKALYYLFGASTLSVMNYIAVPQWFWEGDAVLTETEFTKSGRGRIPYFDLVFRTNLQEGKSFNYNKQYLRSYKHNIADHYVLGYHMVKYLRTRTGNENAWNNITRRAWSTPFLPFTFSRSIKKETGLYVKDLYAEMARDLQKEWQAKQQNLQPTPFDRVHQRKSAAYTDYQFPQLVGVDSVVVVKSGIGDVEELVLLTPTGEKKILTLGPYNRTGMLSVSQGKIVWNEYRFDPRWRVKTFSVIVAYDLKTKLRKQVTAKSRYASAALSPDGNQIATVETGADYQSNLVILDYETGAVLKTFENAENDFIAMPRWSKSGKSIVTLATNKKGKAMVEFDLESGDRKNLTPYTDQNVGHPVPHGGYIFYNAPLSDVDNIFAWDVTTGNHYQVTESRYGAFNPEVSADGKYLYYNEQGRDGFDVVRAEIAMATWKQIDVWKENISFEENKNDLLADVPEEKYEIKNYSRTAHLINPYSWGAYVDNSLTEVDIGITSRDILSTMSLNAGYMFDINERTGSWRAGLSYQGAYPILDVNVSSARRSLNEGDITYQTIIATDTVNASGNLTYKWSEKNLEAGLRLPLLTTQSRFLSLLTIGNFVGVTRVEDFTNSITGSGRLITPQLPQYWIRSVPGNGQLIYNHFFMTGYRYQRQSRRDINPKWGQSFVMHGYGTPFGGDYTGGQFSFYGTLFFPGLFKHHSLWGHWGYQNTKLELLSRNSNTVSYKDNGAYTFRNQIPVPRGQSISRFENFYSMSVNYALPVWYPDVNIGPLLNIQRVRANAFLDYGFGSSMINTTPINQTYISTGAEVKFDINILRLLPQLDIGFRYSYGVKPADTRFELLLGTLNF